MTGVTYVGALCCFVLAVTLPPATAASTAVERPVPQFVRALWSADQGFPGGKVQAITQTADGFLWIGTDQGLTQFDGQSFRTTPASNLAPTPLAPVLGLVTDAHGGVWIRVGRDRLFRYAEGRLDDVLSLFQAAEDAVTAMCRTKNGSVLLAGLVNGLVRYSEGRFETLVPSSRLPSSPITSIIEAADGKLWFGTQEEGVFYVIDGQVFPLKNRLPSLKITSLLWAGEEIWISTDRGLVRLNSKAMTSQSVPRELNQQRVLAMLLDRGRNLWVGTGGGLFRIENDGMSFDRVSRFENAPVSALFEDREGNLWVGQGGAGIERVQESRFTTFGRANGLPSGAGPVYIDSENRVWFGGSEGGLYQLADGIVRPIAIPALSASEVVYAIAGSGAGLWIGSMRGGLTHLEIVNGTKVRPVPGESFTEANGLAQNSVFAAYQAHDGAVWAGTLNGGASRWKDGHLRNFSVANGLASNSVSAIAESRDGTIWVATLRGLSAWSGDRWRSYRIRDGLPSETVNCLFEDATGVLWIGTSEGLAFFSNGAVHSLPDTPRTLRGSVLGLAEDQHGSLWIVTSTTVAQVPRKKLEDGSLSDTDVREFGFADGLPSLGGVRRDHSAVADRDGRIWIANSRGLSVVDPAGLEAKSVPTLTRIEGVSADGNSITPLDQTRIPPGSKRITIDYAGLNLSAPESVRFRYKLENFDRDWSEPTRQRETVYTNLAPGAYRFRVIASNREGGWTGSESGVGLVVDQMFWQTLWFRFAVGLALLGVAIGIYRLRLHQVAERLNVRFEERLAERTRIAQDLHDTLLQGLLSASMHLHIADEKLPEDSPAKPLVQRVLELMNSVSEEGRNVVHGLRSSNRDGDELELAFLRIRQEVPVSEAVHFKIVVEGKPRGLNPTVRDQVYRIGREALVNAFRHSNANDVEVKLGYESSRLRLVFSDNGKGIDPELLQQGRDGHFGLSGMRERADEIGAKLRVSSRIDLGTEIELLVPEHIAFSSPAARRGRWISKTRN